jgi:glycosyltransferase involved in cell wall biosynthesis
VASRIYGITDAVEEGQTGLLFEAGNRASLTVALLIFISDNELRHQMGAAARIRAVALYSSDKIACEMISLYTTLSGSVLE